MNTVAPLIGAVVCVVAYHVLEIFAGRWLAMIIASVAIVIAVNISLIF